MASHPFLIYAVAVVLAAACLGACSAGDVGATTASTTAATTGPAQVDDIVFGSGSVPDSIPDGFPVPETAVIGSTMVNKSAGTTEMIVRMRSELSGAVAYYEDRLEAQGFAVLSSVSLGDNVWGIELSGENIEGTIRFSVPLEGVTDAVIVIRG